MTHQLEFKNCFGAVTGYIDGHIFISCGKFGVALRLPPEILASLFDEKGVKPLKYFPNGHIKKEYAVLPQEIIENKQRFKELLDESIKYASLSQSSHR
ncbi:MAG: TfoX/Sxy family protein [Nitrospirae bacterium]|nr:TfoX/Sxy family protein [Nitrospirota bacterium]